MVSTTDLGTILGVWAHPDDEAYLMAGLAAMAVDAGQQVACVTATLGEAGESADPERWPAEALAEIRRAELERSLALVGITDHTCLGLADGRLADLDATEHVDSLATTIERVRPDTVITFGPDGMTGHADHTTISDWTAAAVARVAPGARLLFATKTREWAASFADVNPGIFPPGLPPLASDGALVVDLDDAVLERKVRALEAHASQTTGLIQLVGRGRYAEWSRLEAFEPAG